MARNVIEIRGAREHNLKGVDLTIPRDKLVVLTGVSGSGKSVVGRLLAAVQLLLAAFAELVTCTPSVSSPRTARRSMNPNRSFRWRICGIHFSTLPTT